MFVKEVTQVTRIQNFITNPEVDRKQRQKSVSTDDVISFVVMLFE